MNFKGTKGKWKITKYSSLGVASENDRLVASAGVYQTNADNGVHITENEHNALLISKAPEMLEMLNKCLEVSKHFGVNALSKEIEELIKLATEL